MAVTGAYGSGNVNIGVTAGNVFRPNVWSREVLMFVKSNLVLLPLIKHYDADVKNGGQTLEIPNVSAITANLKAQNTVVTLGSEKTKFGVIKSFLDIWNPSGNQRQVPLQYSY